MNSRHNKRTWNIPEEVKDALVLVKTENAKTLENINKRIVSSQKIKNDRKKRISSFELNNEEIKDDTNVDVCPICLNLPKKSSIINNNCCGRPFCFNCLIIANKTCNDKCPACNNRGDWNEKDIILVKHLDRMYSKVDIKCIKCEQLFKSAELNNHRHFICPKRDVPCSHFGCQMKIPFDEIKKHERTCKFKKIIPCPLVHLGCNHIFTSNGDIIHHIKTKKEYHQSLVGGIKDYISDIPTINCDMKEFITKKVSALWKSGSKVYHNCTILNIYLDKDYTVRFKLKYDDGDQNDVPLSFIKSPEQLLEDVKKRLNSVTERLNITTK